MAKIKIEYDSFEVFMTRKEANAHASMFRKRQHRKAKVVPIKGTKKTIYEVLIEHISY